MTREEVLNSVEYWRSTSALLKRDIQTLKKSIPKWRRFPDEKPNKSGFNIVTMGADMGEYQTWVTEKYYDAKRDVWDDSNQDISHQILAWQELPEPFKED